MAPEIEERPTHVHLCDGCGEQFECEIENCELVDDEDSILCSSCLADVEDELDPEDEEDL